MQNIDFLPANFHNDRSQRSNRYWYVVVAGVLGLSLAAATVYQYRVQAGIEVELAAVEPHYKAALAARKHLSELRQQAIVTHADAELVTYLGHRWPVTQILGTVFGPLPDSVTLDELVVEIEEISKVDASAARTGRRRKMRSEPEEEKPQGPPSTMDLEQLRGETDASRIVISISGKTRRGDRLHHYVSELGRNDLVAKAEINSIETVSERASKDSGRRLSKFTVRIELSAGHGQKGWESENTSKATVTDAVAKLGLRP